MTRQSSVLDCPAASIEGLCAIAAPGWTMQGGPRRRAARVCGRCSPPRFVLRIVDGLAAQTWRNADDLWRLLRLGARNEDGER